MVSMCFFEVGGGVSPGAQNHQFLCDHVFWLARKRRQKREAFLRDAEDRVNQILKRQVVGGWERPGPTRMETIRLQASTLALFLCFAKGNLCFLQRKVTENCGSGSGGCLPVRRRTRPSERYLPCNRDPNLRRRSSSFCPGLLHRNMRNTSCLWESKRRTMKKAYKVPDSGGGAACTKPPKEGQEAFSALVFRRRMFERVAREIAPEIRGAKELFSKAGTDVPYLFAKKMRFPKSEDAYVLEIQRMEFLDDAVRSARMRRFPASV